VFAGATAYIDESARVRRCEDVSVHALAAVLVPDDRAEEIRSVVGALRAPRDKARRRGIDRPPL
jgi:hypothetical protein